MAYISTDEVKEIRTQLKDVLKSKGITGTIKREHYSKPGVQRREAKKAGIKNSRKKQSRDRD